MSQYQLSPLLFVRNRRDFNARLESAKKKSVYDESAAALVECEEHLENARQKMVQRHDEAFEILKSTEMCGREIACLKNEFARLALQQRQLKDDCETAGKKNTKDKDNLALAKASALKAQNKLSAIETHREKWVKEMEVEVDRREEDEAVESWSAIKFHQAFKSH